MIIYENNLKSTPENASTHDDLQSFKDKTKKIMTAQGNATGTASDDDDCDVAKLNANINPHNQNVTFAKNITCMTQNKEGTSENHFLFPEESNALNNHTNPSLQALEFPALFPFRNCKISNRDCHYDAPTKSSNVDLIKHFARDNEKQTRACLFAEHDMWIDWARNTAERHRENNKKCASKEKSRI